jgi:hypothetical protein
MMLADGADWLFLLEDDIVIASPEAVSGYLRACEESGFRTSLTRTTALPMPLGRMR